MGQSLGDLHYTLGVDESQLDAQLAKAKQKIQQALADPSLTSANLTAAARSAKIDATRALETERLAKANLSNAKATDIAARSQAALNNASQRNTAAQTAAANAAWLAAQRTAQASHQATTAQNQSLTSAQRLIAATNSASISQQRLANHSGVTSRAMLTQNGIALRLGSTLGSAFTIAGIYTFIKQLATVRGEFELQQVALRAITRDKEAADKIFGQVKTLSVMSPFTFQELLRDTKQLAAFSVETDKLYGTLTRLADVSAGLGVDMSRIILAYGQVKAATVLRGQEVRQFTEAGIPMIDMLANKYSKLEDKMVSAGEVFKRISTRMVSFKDVDEVFTSLTSSGGMFFEMQKKQSETLIGKISNLKDAYQIMLNTMGEGQDSKLKGGVDMLTSMMRNWETIADVMKTVIAAYGAFKVAQMIAIANAKLNAAANLLVVESGNTLVLSDARQIAMKIRLNAAQAALNKTMLLNPYVLAAAAVAALGVIMYNAYQNAHKLENELNKLFTESSSEATATVTKVDALKKSLKEAADGTQRRADIIKELNNIMSPYLEKNLKEKDSYEEIAKSVDKATKAMYENARSKLYTAGMAKIDESQKEAIGSAEDRLRSSLKKTFGVGDEIATDIMQGIFSAVRDNPEAASTYTKVIELTKSKIERAAKESGSPIDVSGLLVSTTEGMTPFSGASAIMDFGKSMVKTAEGTELLNQKIKSLSPSLEGVNRIYAIEKKTLDDTWDAEEKRLHDTMQKDDFNKGAHDRKVARMEAELVLLKKYNFEDEASSKNRQIQAEAPEGTLAKRIMLGVDALTQFAEKNREVAKSLIEDKPDSELYTVYAGAIKDAKEELDKALATPVEFLINKSATEADKTAFVKPLREKWELYKTINEKFLGQYEKEKSEKKDPMITRLENQMKLMEEAAKKFEELSKLYGKGTALTIVSKMSGFENIPIEQADQSKELDKYWKQLATNNSTQAKDVKAKIAETQRTFTKDAYIDPFTKALDDIGKFIEDNKEKLNLYQEILSISGDKNKALNIAFGVDFKEGVDIETFFKDRVVNEVKKLESEGKFTFGFDITYENLVANLKDLPEKIKPEIEAIQKSFEDASKKALLARTRILSTETPEGIGLQFDFSNVITGMNTAINKFRNESQSAMLGASTDELQLLNDFTNARTAKEREVARQKIEGIGAAYLEENLKNKQLWNDYSNMSEASVSELKRLYGEIGQMQKGLMTDGGIAKVAGVKEGSPLAGILGDLANADNIDALEARVTEMLTRIADTKEYMYSIGDGASMVLPEGETEKLKLVLTLIKSISSNLSNAGQKTKEFKFKAAIEEAKKLHASIQGVVSGVKGLTSAMGVELDGTAAAVLDGIDNTANAVMTLLQATSVTAIATTGATAVGVNAATTSTAVTAAATMSMVEKASVILAVIGIALAVATAIANIITGNQKKKTDDAIKEQTMLVNQLKMAWDDLERAAARYYNLEVKTDTVEQWTAKQKQAVIDWYNSLNKYGKMAADVQGTVAAKIAKINAESATMAGKSYLEVETANLESQKVALQKQIEAAQGNNKKGKRDSEIQGYRDELNSLDVKIEETQTKWYEGLIGTTLTQASDNFAQGWVDAFLSGEDAMSSFEGKFDDMMKTMIVKQAAQRVMSAILKPWFDQIDAALGVGGTLDAAKMQAITAQIPGLIGSIDTGMKSIIQPLLEAVGLTKGSAIAKAGLQGEIAGIKEDQADLLTSLLNAVRGDVSLQRISLKNIEGLLSATGSVLANNQAQLILIQQNTFNFMTDFRSVMGGKGSIGSGLRVIIQ